MSDNAHTNGDFRPTLPATAEYNGGGAANDQFDAPEAVLRLLIGALLIGADELQSRLQQWQESEQIVRQTVPSQLEPESPRYAFIGLLFETETRMRQQFSATLARFARMSDEAEYLFTTTLAPALRQTPLNPLVSRLDEMLFTAMIAVDRWTARGWLEEQQSRRIARQASVKVVDELLDYMAHNPEVRKLIEQQGLSVADEAVTEARERTATADMWIERLARSLLHRPVSDGAPSAGSGGVSTTNDADG